jgi:Carboxypeptidase regulatory-like domain
MRQLNRVLFALVIFLAMSSSAYAQATLTGVVKDASGAVLPGVTVEAASDVLIEKVRTAQTDGTGRYQIPDLRPGSYSVTFTLTGFATVKREGVPLSGLAVTTADAEMRVGAVAETVTVTGETPVVDLQTATRQRVMDQEIITAVPTSRNSFAVGVLIPGLSLFSGGVGSNNSNQDVGGALGPTTLALTAHGGKTEDQRLLVNGVSLSTMIGGGWGGGAIPNASGIAEMAFDTAAVNAELATGGVRINFIPRDGGNRFSGTVAGSFANEDFQGESFKQVRNFDPVRASTVKVNGELNPGFGGPIKKDRLWFFLSGRYQKADLFVPGIFHDTNANNPNVFTYTPDPSKPAIAPREWEVYQGRLTWQAAAKHKIGVTYDLESNCFCPAGVGPLLFGGTAAPEAGNDQRFPLQRFVQVDWNSPVSPRLLIEASAIHRVERWGAYHLQTGGDGLEPTNPAVIGVNEQTTNFNYRAAPGSFFGPPFNESWNVNLHYRAAVSYITGSHAFKAGFNNAWGHHENTPYVINPYSYVFVNGLPSQIREFATPYTSEVDVDADLGLYAQDKWTHGRFTTAAGVRFDWFKNSFPEQSIGPGPLVPSRPPTTFPETPNLNWKDVTPKLGLTYDLFGTGKTALKTTLNKYLTGYGTFSFGDNNASSAPNPINRLVNNTTRTWIDNGDFKPQCDLTNPLANGECLALQNPNFGTIVPGTVWDSELLNGWGKRQYNWEFSLGVQHELRPRMSVEVSYFRRWYGNFFVTDNQAYSSADFDRDDHRTQGS